MFSSLAASFSVVSSSCEAAAVLSSFFPGVAVIRGLQRGECHFIVVFGFAVDQEKGIVFIDGDPEIVMAFIFTGQSHDGGGPGLAQIFGPVEGDNIIV